MVLSLPAPVFLAKMDPVLNLGYLLAWPGSSSLLEPLQFSLSSDERSNGNGGAGDCDREGPKQRRQYWHGCGMAPTTKGMERVTVCCNSNTLSYR